VSYRDWYIEIGRDHKSSGSPRLPNNLVRISQLQLKILVLLHEVHDINGIILFLEEILVRACQRIKFKFNAHLCKKTVIIE